MDKTEILYSQILQKENLKDWFIECFYVFNFERIEFVIKKYTFTFSKEKTNESLQSYVSIEGQFGGSVFLNGSGYFMIHHIDFDNKKIAGYVNEENVESVLTPEIYTQLHLKIEQYGNSGN
jgi:hypothetical protein